MNTSANAIMVAVEGLGSVDFGALPEASQNALVSRAIAHIFGNEVASRVHAFAIKTVKGDDKADPTKDAVKAWKDANPDAVEAEAARVSKEKWDALIAGTLGVSVGGPRLTPLDSMKRQIARKEVLTILSTHKIKAPTGDNTIELKGEAFTMAQLIDRRLANPETGPKIEAEAKKAIAAAAKKAEALAAGASAEGTTVADLL